MGRALAFYRVLGLDAPADAAGQGQTQIHTPGGTTLGLLTETMMRGADPHWVTPVGQRVTFACLCDSPAEVDAVYARVTGAGHVGLKAPWDSSWGLALRLPPGSRRQPGRHLRADDRGRGGARLSLRGDAGAMCLGVAV